ncbi:MAG: 6-phosphogluconolactonase [Gammaproteobacteria bacterium]|nr:6-phosphogluconolactonase [Gammaproteobacteria bacterium]
MNAKNTLESALCFPDPAQAVSAVAERIGSIIQFSVRARGRASLLLPGGRTPIPVFHALRDQDLPWNQVYISLTDERRCPPDHSDSNARLIQEELLVGPAANAHFYPLHREGVDERADEAVCSAALGMLPRPYDAVMLGMGTDGHTASLFPQTDGLAKLLDLQTEARCATTTAPTAPQARITLTLATLLHSRWIGLHVTGQEKWHTLETAIESEDVLSYPVLALLTQRQVPVHVYWSP